MSKLDEYTFDGLYYASGEGAVESRLDNSPRYLTSLCYLVGLVNSPSHSISDVLPAKRILPWLYEVEEQATNAEHLKSFEQFYNRFFDGGFYPKTPCMVVREWSPIGAMLEREFEPLILNREERIRACATGLWNPIKGLSHLKIELAETDESLFWAIMANVSQMAVEQGMWISVVAAIGWDYESAIGSLKPWLPEEVARAGRVLWKRTPLG